jgi:hypothetical protein
VWGRSDALSLACNVQELVAAFDKGDAAASGTQLSFAAMDIFRFPFAFLIFCAHLAEKSGEGDPFYHRTFGGMFAVCLFFCFSFAFWQVSYPHGQPLYGRVVRHWVATRLSSLLLLYYLVLPVQQIFYGVIILDGEESDASVRRFEVYNWFCIGVLWNYWANGNTVACSASNPRLCFLPWPPSLLLTSSVCCSRLG